LQRQTPDPILPSVPEFDSLGRHHVLPMVTWDSGGNTCFITAPLHNLMRLEGFWRALKVDNTISPVLCRLRYAMLCGNVLSMGASFSTFVNQARALNWQLRAGNEWAPGDPQLFVRQLFEHLDASGRLMQREFVIHTTTELRCPDCYLGSTRSRRCPFIAI